MAEDPQSPGPGGFLQQTLPSPAPTTTSTLSVSGLPHPRAHPLRSGSVKEDKIRRYVEDRVLYINRRYVKKFGLREPGDEVVGYKSMSELCKDVEALINIIWLSGTRKYFHHILKSSAVANILAASLQVPHLLNIAGELTTWVTSFAPSPPATFAVLRKLDHCFASLLSGRDIESKEPLPGFENGTGAGMTRTEMVRCKSLVEQTRVLIVDIMNKEPEDEDGGGDENDDDDVETADETETGTNGTGSFTDPNWDEGDDTLHMDVARVYENTIVQLGEILGEGVSGGI